MRKFPRPGLLLATTLAAGQLAALDLIRGPYVQLGSPDSVLIVWRTGEPADGMVEYGTGAALDQRVSAAAPATDHALALTGLSPGMLYHYRVLGNGSVLADGKSFSTFPAPGAPAFQYRLVVLGDSGTGIQAQLDVAQQIVASAPALGIHIGDIAYPGGTAEEFDSKYFAVYRDTLAGTPFYACLGNKDVELDDAAAFLQAFHLPENSPVPERYYSFQYGNALFVALDTNQVLSEGDSQMAWLDEQLAGSDRFWKIVFFHHAMYSSLGKAAPPHRAVLEPIFEKHRVDLVLSGHVHFYERTYPLRAGAVVDQGQEPSYHDPEGTVYLVTGGGGGVLAQASPKDFSAAYRSIYHHVRIDVRDNVLGVEAVDQAGVVFDHMTITRTPAVRPPRFKRADTDGNGLVDVTDAVALLTYLFLGGPAPDCPDAADADDSGDLGLTDAINSLSWQFLGGKDPPAPGPRACGPDPTPATPPLAPCVYAEERCP